MAKRIGSVLMVILSLVSCATDWFTKRKPEKAILQVESSEKDEAWAEKLRAMGEKVNRGRGG
jgi:hypothetical protein